MSESSTSAADGPDQAASPFRDRLAFDLDVDICVVGAGLAGLTVAREAARLGASVAVLEGRQIGWNASGHHLGTVMPGFGLPISDVIERVGRDDARELWALSKEGADYVRATATEDLIPGIKPSDGALEVSNVDVGEALIGRLQTLGEDFATEVEGWQVDRVRSVLRTGRYFHGIYYPKAFQIDGRKYVHGLAALATRAGVRIFEETPVVSIDFSGIRKRIVTPTARLRANHIVLAGNIHLGAPLKRLSDTLLPVWRYAALTEPLGERLAESIAFPGSVVDSDGIDHFRVVDGDRLLWASPETTWDARPKRLGTAVQRRVATVFPQLGKVPVAEMFGGAVGVTVHGMPQIGQLRRGLWVASGFGRQGLNTSALAGQLIARSILWGDDRWRLFSPFELVWAGGATGRVAGHFVSLWARGASSVAGVLARYREGARAKERLREARLAEANLRAGTRGPAPRRPPPSAVRPARPPAPRQIDDGEAPYPDASQESERISDGRM
ncbi:glycine/D-amino acid oxidase-like deaminating enzyme [Bradyrhizobium sp. USDA 4524]|uniref:NAD(P)/FAD-dependent oxidoreductase n=1 Tax=unclassified Bradyrhizobium TaxID=2631580 RepID=UPI00209FC90C|nr:MULTISPECIES: FAD-binding oxidoreductase [unclassified Bradyrhizobium]MCP1843199.1 glycine/D-amino acid oxidase-like deaminating enzyme [Bradyrhizobium sp. USDA 4538]MCP1903765.1 glycine/D-amino acid oxidase-like deaminating enzyme [Bradyrhizobium sp. USDA 4537]MCP1990579.1 glycine/D-amino acid oxidase-like deaminating enzyme [Bradyrhizobium sp. USDA 4539]